MAKRDSKDEKSNKMNDKYAWRGDADSFDSDLLGPGHVPGPEKGNKASKSWDSYNWGGEETNKWGSLPRKGVGGY